MTDRLPVPLSAGVFGDEDEIRSADLITKLTADPERPWAEWKHGRPLSQKQLGSLLKPFCIISATVHPPGLAHGKGYRRGDFKEAWNVYCPRQNTPLPQFGTSEACKRASAGQMGTSPTFRERAGHLSARMQKVHQVPILSKFARLHAQQVAVRAEKAYSHQNGLIGSAPRHPRSRPGNILSHAAHLADERLWI